MDEETAIINANTRNEKIRNFFINNKRILISIFLLIIILIFSYFGYSEYSEKKKINISNKYNLLVTDYSTNKKEATKIGLIDLINKKDPTYSPLALYFLIDKQLITNFSEINSLFDIIIEDTKLSKEIRNLIIYKKALFNADNSKENELLEILKPIINSNSVWKSHALYLMAEYFYSKNEKQKSKEFFSEIVSLENADKDLKTESQKRINRDFSE